MEQRGAATVSFKMMRQTAHLQLHRSVAASTVSFCRVENYTCHVKIRLWLLMAGKNKQFIDPNLH